MKFFLWAVVLLLLVTSLQAQTVPSYVGEVPGFRTRAVPANPAFGKAWYTADGKQCGWQDVHGVYRPYDGKTDTFGPACPVPKNAVLIVHSREHVIIGGCSGCNCRR